MVHVQSPCTVYNDTYEQLKGNPKKGIEPLAWDIADDHDPADIAAAHDVANMGGVPLGLLYRAEGPVPFEDRIAEMSKKAKPRSIEELVDSYAL